jgi:hypothetical protein
MRVLMLTEKGEDVIKDIIPRIIQRTMKYDMFCEEMQAEFTFEAVGRLNECINGSDVKEGEKISENLVKF